MTEQLNWTEFKAFQECHPELDQEPGLWHQADVIICVVQSFSHVWLFAITWMAACQASCPLLSPGVCSNSCPLSWWFYLTISSSVIIFPSCLQSFPASGSFLVSWLSESSGHSIGASASASVLPMNIQGWFPLGLAGLISLLSKGLSGAFSSTKGLSRVFSNTTVQKHQFFSVQLSLWSNSHVQTTGKTIALTRWTFVSKVVSLFFHMLNLTTSLSSGLG